MVNKDDIIKEILLEVSFRSDEGYPNFSKPAHISILSEVLTDMGLTNVKYELIKNLLKEDEEKPLDAREKEQLEKLEVTKEQHFTQAPPRYTEATLVKKMEELGIGRPSTYASVLFTIQDREYVRKEKNLNQTKFRN